MSSTERSNASSVQLARETRERFVAATEGVIAPTAHAIRERLSSLSSQGGGSAREMHQHRDDFVAFVEQESRWVNLAASGWRRALQGMQAGGQAMQSLSGGGLELIGDEVVENNILSSRLALVIQDKASFELNDLRLRMQYLENTGELSAKDVLRPEVLSKMLVDQWLAAGLTRALWTKVQDVVQQQMLDVIQNAYKDANAFLVSRGIMPEIDLKGFVRRAQGGPSSSPMGFTGRGMTMEAPLQGGAGFAPAAIGLQNPAGASRPGAPVAGAA